MQRKIMAVLGAAALIAGTAAFSMRAWYVNPDGTGFVGKGDVQLVFGWNNKGLQDNHSSVSFRAVAESGTETSWVCLNQNNENEQVRTRTTTVASTGIVSSTARERNQITGFMLHGWSGTATTETTTEGPQLHSCPNVNSSYVLDSSVTTDIPGSSTVQVSSNGTTWADLQ
jgi:hypothetical protein